MNYYNKISIISLVIICVLSLTGANTAHAALAPGFLGEASTYSVFGATGITTAATSTVWGDVGENAAGNGSISIPAGAGYHSVLQTSVVDAITSAHTALGLETPDPTPLNLDEINTVEPGVYTVGTTFSAHLTLHGAGTYIFQGASSITQATDGTMTLEAGACASDVYWYAGSGAMTFTGAGNIAGTIITNTAITFANSALTLKGRALAGSAVTMGNITITEPVTCATAVIASCSVSPTSTTTGTSVTWTAGTPTGGTGTGYTYTWGGTDSLSGSAATVSKSYSTTGTKTATITVKDSANNSSGSVACTNSVAVSAAPVNGVCGTATTTPANHAIYAYTGLTNTFSDDAELCSAGTVPASQILAAAGGSSKTWTCTQQNGGTSATCIATRAASPAAGGSNLYITSVPPIITIVKVPSPLALPNGPGAVTYTYTVNNIGTVPMTNVTVVDDKCSPMIFVSGDTNADSKLDISETWIYDCFSTVSETTTNTVTATGWANGISSIDIASATVVVGIPVIPPLIHITKIPNPLTLSAAGGIVTYTYTVTNPGTAPLSNVNITDDKCTGLPGRVIGHPGDINKNDLLESNESWIFTCQSKLTKTTTNVGTASGDANGLTAKDYAIATVVVVAPALPNTGFGPNGVRNMAILLGIIMLISFSAIVALKKRKI